jgi:glutamate N-acetyltransferase/amino-acid N-acetyltransferase
MGQWRTGKRRYQSNWENLVSTSGVCNSLAEQIVRDGEGATKFVTIQVIGAPDDYWDEVLNCNAAQTIAYTVATSPLVKTAFYGNDANWGRIIAAAGRAGIPLVPEKLKLWVVPGGHLPDGWPPHALPLFLNGMPTDHSEEQATAIVSQPSFSIILHCGIGNATATVYTCDLSHDYVSINADYRS